MSKAKVEKPVKQPTTFGDPDKKYHIRFYEFSIKVLRGLNAGMFALILISLSANIALLVMVGIVIKHAETYASDGSDYSCRLTSQQELKNGK